MKNVLILGPRGFIGSNLIRYLEKDKSLKIFMSNGHNYWNFDDNIEIILNCTGISHFDSCEKDKTLSLQKNACNILPFLETIEKYSPATRFINLGSVKEFQNNSWYSVTKKISREIITFFREQRGLWASQLYLCNIVGPGQDAERFLIPKIIRAAKEKNITKFGNLDSEIKIMYIDDACELIWKAANSQHPEDFLLKGTQTTPRELIVEIFKRFNIDNWQDYVEYDENLKRIEENVDLSLYYPILSKKDSINSINSKLCLNS